MKTLPMESFSGFVVDNENADTAKLLLSRERYAGFDIDLAVNTIEVRRKLKKKVPSWYRVPELAYPLKLSGEQCSSEAAAMYKARILQRLFPEGNARVADLTGGLGVDSWAFSTVAASVLYNEMNPALASSAERNFRLLGRDNISVVSFRLVPEKQCGNGAHPEDGRDNVSAFSSARGEKAAVPEMTAGGILGSFRPDLIYLDPARRDAGGKKVFLIEDCSPDVLALKDDLFSQCRHVLLKLSPMADISMIYDRLGKQCREIHILASEGECKEVLVLMDREFDGECTVTAGTPLSVMQFGYDELRHAVPRFLPSADSIFPGAVLYEPGKALMKAGAFNVLCSRFGLTKLGRSTHYYIMDRPVSGSSSPARTDAAGIVAELSPFGKFHEIEEILPLANRTLKETGKRLRYADVTARNIPMDSETLRKKMNFPAKPQDGIAGKHVFGLRCEAGNGESGNYLFITRRMGL